MTQTLDVPVELWRTGQTPERWMASARGLVELTARRLGHTDLGGLSVLDVGCGTKLSKVILEDDLPLGRYVGVDTHAPVIDFLRAEVHDDRFSYVHVDVHNAMYNTGGTALADLDRLPVGDAPFDVITLFSVFTHLAPHDYTAMLRVLRPHVAEHGRLLFSLFIDEPVEAGYGYRSICTEAFERRIATDPTAQATLAAAMAEQSADVSSPLHARLAETLRSVQPGDDAALDAMAAALTSRDGDRRTDALAGLRAARTETPELIDRLRPPLRSRGVDVDALLVEAAAVPPATVRVDLDDRSPARADASGLPPEIDGFVDAAPEFPLRFALYTREHAYELVAGTGWDIVEEHPPNEDIQHHLICRPV